jgi:hypothetical protein
MKVRNWKSKVAMSLVAAGVGSCTAQADITSTLIGTSLGNNLAIPDNHGSTAEATLVWSPDGGTPSTTWDAWNWPNSGVEGAYQIDGLRPWISFTPIAGHRVGFNSVDLNLFSGPNGPINYEIRIWAGTAPGADGTELALFSGVAANNFPVYNANDSTITPVNMNFFGSFDQALTIEFRQNLASGQFASYLAMDNFTFQTQAIPEPGTLAVLGLAGLGATMMRRRRNK